MTDINILLDKYWEGETTPEQENILKKYFNSEQVAPEHEQFAPLFEYFDAQAAITYGSELTFPEAKIKEIGQKEFNKSFQLRRFILAAAASLVLILGATFIIKTEVKVFEQSSLVHEIEDPEEALEVTKKALAMLSGKLDKSTNAVRAGIQNIEKANIQR
ncbi:MAG: hypothetical protein IPM42_02070 [Saprospiraceae bacterium]|nr:hypothetical protein [Saprospiraceae bacterium]